MADFASFLLPPHNKHFWALEIAKNVKFSVGLLVLPSEKATALKTFLKMFKSSSSVKGCREFFLITFSSSC